MIISIFIPHGGCPERCTFCDQRTSGGTPTAIREVESVIQMHLASKSNSEKCELAFYGGTFTAMPREVQRRYLDVAQKYIALGYVESIRISTRPDAVDREWFSQLKQEYGLRVVEFGIQSHRDSELKWLGRSHSTQDSIAAIEMCRELGLKSGAHFIFGAPGAAVPGYRQELVEWISKKLRPDFLRIHPLVVLEGTPLAEQWRSGTFAAQDLETAVDHIARLVSEIENLGLPVVRIGLQANDLFDAQVLAGAYHPAFGEMVRSRMLRHTLEEKLVTYDLNTGDSLDFAIFQSLESQIKGQKNSNLEWLKQRFALGRVGVSVLKDTTRDDTKDRVKSSPNIEVRISNASGITQRRQIHLTQRPSWR